MLAFVHYISYHIKNLERCKQAKFHKLSFYFNFRKSFCCVKIVRICQHSHIFNFVSSYPYLYLTLEYNNNLLSYENAINPINLWLIECQLSAICAAWTYHILHRKWKRIIMKPVYCFRHPLIGHRKMSHIFCENIFKNHSNRCW